MQRNEIKMLLLGTAAPFPPPRRRETSMVASTRGARPAGMDANASPVAQVLVNPESRRFSSR